MTVSSEIVSSECGNVRRGQWVALVFTVTAWMIEELTVGW